MARNGYQIFASDTYVGPAPEILGRYLTAQEQARLASWEPYSKAAAEYDLDVVLHTFTVMPPYAPGGLDPWDNLWLQRSAAHP